MTFSSDFFKFIKKKIMLDMTLNSKAKIFLADERGCDETEWYRSYSTFNFSKYFNEHKKPFENLYILNDNTLAGGRSSNIIIEKNSLFLLLPVVGAVHYKDAFGYENTVHAGQLHVSDLHAGSAIEVSNPFKNELINFLEILIEVELSDTTSKPLICSFDLNENKNELIALLTAANSTQQAKNPLTSIGKFSGREEAIYRLKNKQNSLFIFVIQGVFEVQGRLLHARDSLGLWNLFADIELEALSNDAVVLVIELN